MSGFVSSIRSKLSSEERVQLLWWYLVVVVSTIIFKFNYLDVIYRGGISIAIENYLTGDTLIEYMKIIGLMFVRNISEVAILLALLYFLICKLFRIDQKVIIVVSTLIIFLMGAANQLSLLNVRSLLSYDSLMVTINWMRDNPDVITSYINKRNLVYFALFVCLTFLPLLVSRPIVKIDFLMRLNRVLFSSIVISIALSLLLYFSIIQFVKANANLKPFDGYWGSVAASFIGGANPSPLERETPAIDVMKSRYHNLVYQNQGVVDKQRDVNTMARNNDKKHIVIISLETAPQKYYPIVNNPELQNFNRMSKNSIVTNMHFTNSPYTHIATYAMLTGMYVPKSGIPILYGKMYFNGLANVLSERGYISTYIDSYYIDWHKGDERKRTVESYGFEKLYDRSSYNYKNEIAKLSGEFEQALYVETVSLKKVVESIDDAVAANKKSLVFVDTIMGHFKWKAVKEDEGLSGEEKILKLAAVFDKLLGDLLASLNERNLKDDVIIVVTGDHGLRYHEEYSSLDELDSNIAVSFNVPLMIYSSGLFKEQIVLDHVTSHVDLTPTLLQLVGVDISNYFFHGENILDPALKQRMVFMMNQNLKPENSFYRKGNFYTLNDLSGELYVTAYRGSNARPESSDVMEAANPDLDSYTAKIIKNAEEQFNDSAAYFLQTQ